MTQVTFKKEKEMKKYVNTVEEFLNESQSSPNKILFDVLKKYFKGNGSKAEAWLDDYSDLINLDNITDDKSAEDEFLRARQQINK